MCKYCEKGKINDFGEEIFLDLPFENRTFVYHERPYILKVNNKYFMCTENFKGIEIKACPMCGKRLGE